MSNDITTILASAVRLSVPLSFAGVGEYIAERAGTLNISVEAMMLAALARIVRCVSPPRARW